MKARDALFTLVLVMIALLLWRRLTERDAMRDRMG